MPPSYTELAARLQEKEAEVVGLKAENAWLKKQLFGPGKSEKTDRLQTNLPLAESPAAEPPAKVEQISYERVAAPRSQRETPAETFQNVPVKETVVIEPDAVKANPAAYERIGEERTFEIDVTAPQIFKREIIRPKYRHRSDRAQPPLVAPAPERPVVGGYASAGLLAWIAYSKHVEHVPLYRLERQSQRWGAAIPRQTMADWVRITAEWLEPIYRQIPPAVGRPLPAGRRDPDPLQRSRRKTRGDDGRLALGHQSSGRGRRLRLAAVAPPWGTDEPDRWLCWNPPKRCRGAYESHARSHPEVIRVGCWAHARRKFFDAQRENPKAVAFVLRIIGWLYECEARWDETNLTTSNRQRHRQKHYRRPLYWLHKVVIGLRQQVLPKSGLGKACDYLLRNWEALTRHLELGKPGSITTWSKT